MLSTRSATALYVGAVLGPGVLLIPSLAAEAAGPASVLAWAALLALSRPARGHVRRARRAPPGGRRHGRLRARRVRPRAPAAVTGWWFLAGVVIGAPAVALIGGFYVAELLGGGRARRGRGRGGDDRRASCSPTRAACTRPRALQLGLAGVLAALLLVAVVTRAARRAAPRLDPVRPARLGRGRHRREPADVLVHRLGGGIAPRRRAARPARGSSRARSSPRSRSSSCSTSGSRSRRSACSARAAPSDVPLADLMAAGLGAPGRTRHRGARRAADDGRR